MPDQEIPEASDWYSERLIRSVAHNIGNAVNVLSGRLSLLEMEEGMRPESLEMLALMKDRLRRTQGELRGAVRFVSETLRDSSAGAYGVSAQGSSGSNVLTAIRDTESALGPIARAAETMESQAAQTCRSNGDLRFALHVLGRSVRALVGSELKPSWSLDAKPEGLALEVPVAATLLPSDRRALMEPWFEAAAINLSPTERKARLEMAVALSWLEDSGANISVLPQVDEGHSISRLQVLWNYV